MGMVFSIIFIALVVFNIVLYHKIFDVVYFDLGRGILKELFWAFLIAAIEAGLIGKYVLHMDDFDDEKVKNKTEYVDNRYDEEDISDDYIEDEGDEEDISDDYIEDEGDEDDVFYDDYIFPESDSRYLKKSDLKNCDAKTLRLGRNEIYARYGRRFQDSELQEYFDSTSWYIGLIEPEDFDESVLNEYEKKNLKIIKEYENK